MIKREIESCLKLAACICAKDGVLSQAEEEKIFQLIQEKFPDFTVDDFEKSITDFFESNDQIEDYLNNITSYNLRIFALELSKISASVDGLDIRENIALKKAYSYWGVPYHE